MKTEEIALSRVSENEANPREISQANFQKLVQSIIVFPRMLTLRPIVVDETFHALGGNAETETLHHRSEHANVPRPYQGSIQQRGYSFEHRILLSRNKKPDIEGIVAYHQQDGRFRHSRILQEVQRTVRLSETEPQGQRTVLQEHEGTVRPAGNALLCIGRTLQGTLPQRKLLRIAANVELQQGADVRSTEHLQAQGIREVERHQAVCRDFLEGETG